MKFCVIGLGRFGYQVATVLAENGMEVMAIDSSESIVNGIKDKVTQAICMRVIDDESLASIGVDEMDTAIVGIGEEFDQSVLVTVLLKKKLGIPRVISRASNDIHKDILKLVGADRVILPEKEIGIRLADKLSSPFLDIMRLSKEYSISQITAPSAFVGKSIDQLNLFTNHQVTCIGSRKDDNSITPIGPRHIITAQEKLIFAGLNKNLEKIARL